MRCSRHALVLVVGSLVLWTAGPIRAQMPMPIPDRPTLSPWLNLYSRNQGPLGNYLSIVRPEQRLLNRLSEQRASLEDQGSAINELQKDLAEPAQPTAIAPTGVRASFMNASQYFGNNNQPAMHVAARGGQASWTPPPARTRMPSTR